MVLVLVLETRWSSTSTAGAEYEYEYEKTNKQKRKYLHDTKKEDHDQASHTSVALYVLAPLERLELELFGVLDQATQDRFRFAE